MSEGVRAVFHRFSYAGAEVPLALTPSELVRYARHMTLPEFGEEGQRRLKAARVLIVGAGGLGSPAALYLTAAGVGTLGLVDFDDVDETNLQRQILYGQPDVGRPKLDAAAERLRDLNPHVRVVTHQERLAAANALRLVGAYDLVIDGSDNFSTRYAVNDACVLSRKPCVYGSVSRFEGQVSVFSMPGGPCYRCLHPEPPPEGLIPSCAEAGVLGVLPGLVGTLQATEAIKIISGAGEPLVGRLQLIDALRMTFRQIALPRDAECPVCGDHPTIRDVVDYDRVCEDRPVKDAMTVDELRQWRSENRPHLLIDVREPSEHARASIDGAQLIPFGQLAAQLDALPRDRPIVVHCQSGGRSARATSLLRSHGLEAYNLSGGIHAWRTSR